MTASNLDKGLTNDHTRFQTPRFYAPDPMLQFDPLTIKIWLVHRRPSRPYFRPQLADRAMQGKRVSLMESESCCPQT